MYQTNAIKAALAAGAILREKLLEDLTIEHKGAIDLLTNADKAAETAIIRLISQSYPNHKILAEEAGDTGALQGDYLWLIDPLDGTTNFAHRFPYFSVSIALLYQAVPILGVVYNPVANELFVAEKGQGATCNGQPIQVSTVNTLQDSLLSTGFPYDIQNCANDNVENYRRLLRCSQGVLRAGSAALDLCHVACGRTDGFWEFSLKSWDMVAGALIVAEAGGKISCLNGTAFNTFGNEILASNSLLHTALQSCLQR